jgi:hypothetical protein
MGFAADVVRRVGRWRHLGSNGIDVVAARHRGLAKFLSHIVRRDSARLAQPQPRGAVRLDIALRQARDVELEPVLRRGTG